MRTWTAASSARVQFQWAMMTDLSQAAKAIKDAEIEAEIEDFPRRLQSAHLPRHAGQWGPRGYMVEPARLERSLKTALAVAS